MATEIIVSADFGETRAALLEDRRLVELFLERETHELVVGNIYKGRVENVLPGMQAAFINIGLERNAFLYVDDVHDGLNGDESGSGRIRSIDDVVAEGDEIIVQVNKGPIGTKGARVGTHLSIAGRYLVLMPTVEHIAISRRITSDGERQRLKDLAAKLCPKGMGVIVRTLAHDKTEADLAEDFRFLLGIWRKIQRRARTSPPPALLYKDFDLMYRLLRDEFTPEVTKFVIDGDVAYRTVLELADSISPALKRKVYQYSGPKPIFEFYGIEEQIERALEREVGLDCGGSIVIDHTEALTSIDVNTGRFIGTTDLADTVLQTNLEAAEEIARQLRLRDIGGIIIIDFIDMDKEAHRQAVLDAFNAALKSDKTRSHILGFTNLGLLEMTRKKVGEDILSRVQKTCSRCAGTGRVVSEETIAHRVQREVVTRAKATEDEALLITCHPAVAALLIGPNGAALHKLEQRTGKQLYVKGSHSLNSDEVDIFAGLRTEVERRAFPVHEGQVLEMEIEETHITNPKDGIARIEGYVIDVEDGGHYVGEQHEVEITRVFRTYAKGKLRSV